MGVYPSRHRRLKIQDQGKNVMSDSSAGAVIFGALLADVVVSPVHLFDNVALR